MTRCCESVGAGGGEGDGKTSRQGQESSPEDKHRGGA